MQYGTVVNNAKTYELQILQLQFVGEQRERSSVPVTEDSAMHYLLGKFKEYTRKPQVRSTEESRRSIGH